uniref:Protein kinase domain-containing protein n=1 Tax=Kalanchoe fedtschenkoi TaxID=63787 RepID=A0A7N0UKS2_KALFE
MAASANFSCSSESPTWCSTYVTYHATSPGFMNLKNISELFTVNPASIARASNIASEKAKLSPGQVLFIPITCGCTGTRYFANITYHIRKTDSFYLVSTALFQNLTDYVAVESMNPSLNPIALPIGDEVVIPIYCKCSEKNHSWNGGRNFLITYVLQPGDDLPTLSSLFKTSPDDITSENNNFTDFVTASGSPILIPVSELPVLPQTRLKSKTGVKKLILVIITSIFGALAVLVLASFLVYMRRASRRTTGKALGRSDSSLETSGFLKMRKNLPHETILRPKMMAQDKLLPGLASNLGNPIAYDRRLILEATGNLSESCRIGGSVYKAMINNEQVAVKKVYEDSNEELKILQKLNHANLVKLMGASTDLNGNRLLVYEFAENGSLDRRLFFEPSSLSPSSKPVGLLTWHQRLQIALDVAHGLQYLHEHTQPSIVHSDIRTSNILLGSGLRAKISNFSSARPAMSSVSPKVDVFGFGVVLLELLSGKRGMEMKESGETVMLSEEIRGVMEVGEQREERRLRLWMDPRLEGSYPVEGAMSLAGLARACTQDKSSARPSMTEVVFNLSVLAHSPSTFETSWASGEEDETKMVRPVVAR